MVESTELIVCGAASTLYCNPKSRVALGLGGSSTIISTNTKTQLHIKTDDWKPYSSQTPSQIYSPDPTLARLSTSDRLVHDMVQIEDRFTSAYKRVVPWIPTDRKVRSLLGSTLLKCIRQETYRCRRGLYLLDLSCELGTSIKIPNEVASTLRLAFKRT